MSKAVTLEISDQSAISLNFFYEAVHWTGSSPVDSASGIVEERGGRVCCSVSLVNTTGLPNSSEFSEVVCSTSKQVRVLKCKDVDLLCSQIAQEIRHLVKLARKANETDVIVLESSEPGLRKMIDSLAYFSIEQLDGELIRATVYKGGSTDGSQHGV